MKFSNSFTYFVHMPVYIPKNRRREIFKDDFENEDDFEFVYIPCSEWLDSALADLPELDEEKIYEPYLGKLW